MEHPNIRGLSGWKPLARGGFTLVWEARQDLLTRLVAVKVYQRGLAEDVYDMFSREAGAVGRLSDHPGVVTAYDAGLLPDSRPYLIMELCPGGSLTQWLNPEDRRSEDQIRSIGVRVADALAAVHARGLLHRDVKPANILIDSFGSPRLADFGLATVAGAESSPSDVLKLTPAYAPPEAFARRAATESGDVYSLAATLYALLSGGPLRSRPTDGGPQTAAGAGDEPITPIPGVNWFLMDVLLAALSSDPSSRPSAADLRDQLSGVPGPRSRKPKPGHAAAEGRTPALVLTRLARSSDAGNATVAVVADAGTAADPPRAHDHGKAGASRRRAPRRIGILAVAAVFATLAASGAAWLITEPASSGAPVAVTRSAEPVKESSGPVKESSGPVKESSGPVKESSGPASSPAAEATSSPEMPTVDDAADSAAQEIRLKDPTASAEPFETVRISGTYPGGEGTFLQVQHRSDGIWQTFPVPTKTDSAGKFTAHVELGQPGRYRLRVLDPQSGVASEPFLLVIKK